MKKLRTAFEIILIVSAIMFRIWGPMPAFLSVALTAAIIATIVLRLILNRENLESVGLKPKDWNTWPVVKKVSILSTIAILVIGLLANETLLARPLALIPTIFVSIVGYFFWALFQQLLLNGYLLNRLYAFFEDKKLSVLWSATIFSMIHLPNLFLIIGTFLLGIFSTNLFFKSRNIYPLAFIHALLAALISHLLPTDWHHYLIIGPRFFE